MHFAEYIYNIAPLKTLLQSGKDINVTNYKGESIFVESVKFNRVENVKLLLEHGADVNVVDDNQDSPLVIACQNGHSDCLRLLLHESSAGKTTCKVNMVNSKKETGAMLASRYGHVDCLKLLLDVDGVDLSLRNEVGDTALSLATAWNHEESVKVLLEHFADPNARNYKMEGRTSLHVACLKGYSGIVNLLIRFGADVNVFQAGRLTPLMNTALKNHGECAKYLLDADADCNLKDNEGITATTMAACKGSSSVLVLLMEAGADINACDIYGGFPIKYAIHCRNWECVDLLLAHGAFVKQIYNVHKLCGDDQDVCDKLTDLLCAAGGNTYTGDEESLALEKRKHDHEEKENNSIEVSPLYLQCKELVRNIFAQLYPSTNLFPIVQSLPIPVGLKRSLLNGLSINCEVSFKRALKCTSFAYKPSVCAMCLRSESEIARDGRTLEICELCQAVAYCNVACRRTHWTLTHRIQCQRQAAKSDSWGPVCAYCLVSCSDRAWYFQSLTCGTCERVIYCSPGCQTTDWLASHKKYCSQRRPNVQYVNLR